MVDYKQKKYIGTVKWFDCRDDFFEDYDKPVKDYGFINHPVLGDLFFHKNNIAPGQGYKYFQKNTVVVFRTRESRKETGKQEAFSIQTLEKFFDIKFLFYEFLLILNERTADYQDIKAEVFNRIITLSQEGINEHLLIELRDNYLEFLNSKLGTDYYSNSIWLKYNISISKKIFSSFYNQLQELFEKNAPIELLHNLWIRKYYTHCQHDHIRQNILTETHENLTLIFNRCTDEDKTKILSKMVFDLEDINSEEKYEIAKKILTISKTFASELYERLLSVVLKTIPVYFKLNLWLDDLYDFLEFNEFKLYTITLTPSNQKKFIKKVLKYIQEKKADITIEDFVSLNVIDYETSQKILAMDNIFWDYSTSILLEIISDLNKKIVTTELKEQYMFQNRIYDIILNQIKNPEDILQITGYFDECDGRCSVLIKEKKDEAGKVIHTDIVYNKDENNKAINHPICDGRKANHNSGNDQALTKENIDFWWCANQRCYKPARKLHNPEEWEQYSLMDFLNILNIEFNENDLVIYLSIINKTNRFLKHLRCRQCNNILYPRGRSNYAFYGVNNFTCNNENCSEIDKEVYLSHCLNGFCNMIIDSRDSVKCKNGWYICNYCYACCSTKKLEKRKEVTEHINKTIYRGPLIGHKDLGSVSCNKCGEVMSSIYNEDYKRILNWFIINQTNSRFILNSGLKKNKRWFKITKGPYNIEVFKERLGKYRKLGFIIPDINTDKDVQLIIEPNGIFNCTNCDNSIVLVKDKEKVTAFKKYHKIQE